MEVISKIVLCTIVLIQTCHVQSEVKPIQLPSSLQRCLRNKDENYASLTDDEAIGSCMIDFMWVNNIKCKGISTKTVKWFASLAFNRSRYMDHHPHNRPKERKEYRMLTDYEREEYHRAIQALKQNTDIFPNKYDAFAIFHQGLAGTAAHRGPAFLGWHRFFLFLYEQALQEEVPGVMLPYWDSTLDSSMQDPTDSVIWTDLFCGSGNGSVRNGPFANWMTSSGELTRAIGQGQLMNKERILGSLRNHTSHRTFMPEIEQQHDSVHLWVGGHMGQIEIAPSDPVFYMHHAFIDCIWELFRERLRRINVDPENDYPEATGGHAPNERMANLPRFKSNRRSPFDGRYLTNKDGYRDFWTKKYYKCAPWPVCSFENPDCGSKWLQCNIFVNRCVSKGSAAALPKITPEQLMNLRKKLIPSQSRSSTVLVKTLPKITKELISSGETFFSHFKSFSFTRHRRFKRRISFFIRRGNTLHEVQTRRPRRTPKPTYRTMIVTFPAAPFHHVQTTSRTVYAPTTSYTTAAPQIATHPPVVSSQRRFSVQRQVKFNTQPKPKPKTEWNIDQFYIPKIEKPCDGYPIQNTFIMDCVANTNLWGFVPIKVVHVRSGNQKYTTYPVGADGRYVVKDDVYSQGWVLFSNGWPVDKRPTTEKCREDKSGLVKIRVTSYGLNYAGTYSDHVFIDNRQPVASAVSFIAVKNPMVRETKVLFTAVDQCGLSCRAHCLIKQRKNKYPKYQECSGAVKVSSDSPYGYSNSYRGAAKQVWCPNSDVPEDDTIMYEDDSQVPVIFYCDYQNYRPQKLFYGQ